MFGQQGGVVELEGPGQLGAGQSSSRAALFDGQGSWTSSAETLKNIIVFKRFSTLVTI